MTVLLTGGAGYIGSHTAVELLNAGHDVVIADNYANSSSIVAQRITRITGKPVKCYEADAADPAALERIFQENAIDVPFYGAYAEKAGEPLVADTLRYLTGEVLDACTVYDYETDAQEPLYDLSAVETDTPYDLYLQGSRSLLRIDSPLSASDKTLVVFRDSFGSSLIPLLAESYRTIYAVDIRYLSSQMVGRFLSFDGSEDVLFLYSTMVLQNSRTMK